MTAHNDQFINRELSWLELTQRVIDKSADRGHPMFCPFYTYGAADEHVR